MSTPRRALLAGGVLVTTALTWWAASLPDDVDLAPVVRAHPAAEQRVDRVATWAPPEAEPPPVWLLPARQAPPERAANPFAPLRPPAPPVRVQPAPPPTEVAPVFPFTAIGRMTVDGREAILLSQGVQTHVIGIDMQIGEFRLDSVDGATFNFVHLPTGQRHALQVSP